MAPITHWVCPFCTAEHSIYEEHVTLVRIGPMEFDQEGKPRYQKPHLEEATSKTLRCDACAQTFDEPAPVLVE